MKIITAVIILCVVYVLGFAAIIWLGVLIRRENEKVEKELKRNQKK